MPSLDDVGLVYVDRLPVAGCMEYCMCTMANFGSAYVEQPCCPS